MHVMGPSIKKNVISRERGVQIADMYQIGKLRGLFKEGSNMA
jgi:hypothetical protein